MTTDEKIKLISYLRVDAAEVLRTAEGDRTPVITDHDSEASAMLKLVALGRQDVAACRVVPAREAIAALRSRLRDGRTSDLGVS